MTSPIASYLENYDFNLPLDDAFNDPELSPDRRAMAAVSRRQCLRDAAMSVEDLRQAFAELAWEQKAGTLSDTSPASERINAILRDEGDDYQRRIYYIVSELPIPDALDDLTWLGDLLKARFRMFQVLRDAGAPMPMLPGAGTQPALRR